MNKIYLTDTLIQFTFSDQELLAKTFLRFQEYYESPNFRNKVFNLDEFKAWYAKEYGEFTYYSDWSGFNIPSYILDPFRNGDFNPLSTEEQALLNLLETDTGKFYIIGTSDEADAEVIEHEKRHALFYSNDLYKSEVVDFLKDKNTNNVKDHLLKIGYHESVLVDEVNAYLSVDKDYLQEKGVEFDESLIQPLNSLYRKHSG